MTHGQVDALAARWHQAGVAEGDVLLVHSSASRTVRHLDGANRDVKLFLLLESLRRAVGANGTLLLPLFNFDFTSGSTFDRARTPSHMGALSDYARQHPDAVRTGHPIYSFVAIGRDAPAFADVDNFSGYGADSPFAMLREADGRIAVLDLPDQSSMTFYHHVEEMAEVDYRFHKTFTGLYTDGRSAPADKTYGLFVRDTDRGVETSVDGMAERLWRAGLYAGDTPGEGSGLRTIRARDLYDETLAVIQAGEAEGLLFRIADAPV